MDIVTDYSQYLKSGKDNARPAAELAAAAGFADARSLQKGIARSRAAGQIILSSTTGGYYLPADSADILEFIHTMEARAKNIMAAVKSARKAIQAIEGQMTVYDLAEINDPLPIQIDKIIETS